MSRQHLSWGHLSISAIPQLLLALFGSNFKQRVLGTYTTDYNCHHDICPDNICPGDISPYRQYLSCYWPDLDQALNKGSWEHIKQITTVTKTSVQATFVHTSNISIFKLNTFDFSLVWIIFDIFQIKVFTGCSYKVTKNKVVATIKKMRYCLEAVTYCAQ